MIVVESQSGLHGGKTRISKKGNGRIKACIAHACIKCGKI